MRRIGMHSAFLLIGLLGLGCAAASGQADAARAISRTDVALSFYGAFSGTTTGNGVAQSPSNAAGGMVEVRHIANPILGFGVTYSYNRANEVYNPTEYACPGGAVPTCNPPPTAIVPANAHEITGDWVPSVTLANFRPFAVLGIGLLLNVPAGGQASASTDTKAVYVYGAGLDWGLAPHIGLRLQYRGNLYQAPDVTQLYTSTKAFTHTSEPMIGAYFRF
jgi:opacity protein-like surface antigen